MGFRSDLVNLILFAIAMYVLFRLLSKAADALLDRYASWRFPSWRYRINVTERESREIKAGRHRFVAVETGKEHLLGWPK